MKEQLEELVKRWEKDISILEQRIKQTDDYITIIHYSTEKTCLENHINQVKNILANA